MYYPDLLTLSCYNVMKPFIEQLDVWLASLPSSIADRITVENISNTFGVQYELVKSMLDELCKIGVLEHSYAITCPECEFTLKITDKKNLVEDLSKIIYCYECEQDIEPTSDDIFIMYKRIKQPDRAYSILKSNTVAKIDLDIKNSLTKGLNEDIKVIDSFYFAPDVNEYKKLEHLFTALDADYGANTTAKGAALDKFISYLFEIVPGFDTSTELRKKKNVNQIDCCIKNKCIIKHSMFEVMGPVFIMECKNEKSVPGNTYFNKLVSIMDTMGIKFGMIISRIKWAATCDDLAWEKYLKHGIVVVNLYDDDYKSIIYDKKNLLDIIHNKYIDLVTHSSKQLFK